MLNIKYIKLYLLFVFLNNWYTYSFASENTPSWNENNFCKLSIFYVQEFPLEYTFPHLIATLGRRVQLNKHQQWLIDGLDGVHSLAGGGLAVILKVPFSKTQYTKLRTNPSMSDCSYVNSTEHIW